MQSSPTLRTRSGGSPQSILAPSIATHGLRQRRMPPYRGLWQLRARRRGRHLRAGAYAGSAGAELALARCSLVWERRRRTGHSGAWCKLRLTECLRDFKPSGQLVAFGGTRTWHRLAATAEDLGSRSAPASLGTMRVVCPRTSTLDGPPDSDLGIEPAHWEGGGQALCPPMSPSCSPDVL